MKARYVICEECGLHGMTNRLACECGRIFREIDVKPAPGPVTLFGLLPEVEEVAT